MLAESHPAVEETARVDEVAADPGEEIGGWRAGIGQREIVDRLLQAADGDLPDVARMRPAAYLDRREFVVETRLRSARSRLAGFAPGKRPAGPEDVVEDLGDLRGGVLLPGSEARDQRRVAVDAAGEGPHADPAGRHSRSESPSEVVHRVNHSASRRR